MKKILINIAVAISGIFCLTSCNDFLDQDPPLYVNEGDVYSNPARIESTLLGLYGSIKNSGTKSLIGGKGYLIFDNRGDDLNNVSNNLTTLFDTYNMKVGDSYSENTDFWTVSYLAVNRINVFLESIESSTNVLDDATYKKYKAEAKFLRALLYYYLNNLYAQPYVLEPDAKAVPLRLTGETSTANNRLASSTVKEVYTQILLDLDDASISALSTDINSYVGVTRATKGAAYMLRQRVYMAMGDWTKAVEAGKSVQACGYTLVSDVTSLYKSPYFTTESIFSLPMADNNVPNTQQGLAEYYSDGKILLVDKTDGVVAKAAYSLPVDERVKNFIGSDNKLLKFTDIKSKLDWVPIFRYAEALLSTAESYAKLGGADNEKSAKALLKQVRSRSIKSGDVLDIEALSGDALKTAISNERRLELIGEGVRGIDIVRKGEDFVKGKIVTKPSDSGYLFPIPLSEKLTNPDVR